MDKSYIETLEKQNEELRNQLEEAEEYIDRINENPWTPVYDLINSNENFYKILENYFERSTSHSMINCHRALGGAVTPTLESSSRQSGIAIFKNFVLYIGNQANWAKKGKVII